MSTISTLWTKLKLAAADATDPGRDQRIEHFAGELRRALIAQRDHFSLEREALRLGMTSSERRHAATGAYRQFVRRSWEDEQQTAKERRQLDWIAAKLELRSTEQRQVDHHAAQELLRGVICHIFADGDVTNEELDLLDRIADSIGTTTGALVQHLHRQDATGLLRRQFADAAPSLPRDPDRWTWIASTARRLGFTEADIGALLEQQVKLLLGHFFADATADNRLDAAERAAIDGLLARLPLRPSVREHFNREAARLAMLTDIADGRMPSANITAFALDAGERGFFQGVARFQRTRNLRSGPRLETHDGVVGITDTRLLFRGDERSFAIRLRKLIGVDRVHGGVDVSSGGRADGTLLFPQDPGVPSAILLKALSLAKQTTTEAIGERSRFISRDVRQRIWQKYAGACADCGATEYLEFDHIVPVARGGSNSEQNVQLLCRNCNIAKSDRI